MPPCERPLRHALPGLLLCSLAWAQETPPPPPVPALRIFWQEGIHVQTRDENFRLQITTRVDYDSQFFDADNDIEAAVGEIDAGNEFRRRRLGFKGDLFGRIGYALTLDDTRDRPLLIAQVELNDLPVLGMLRLGHFGEPFGLERTRSSRYAVMVERSISDALNVGRNRGVMVRNQLFEQRMTWATGVFRPAEDVGRTLGDGYGITGRVTWLPYVTGDETGLLHLGVAYSYRRFADDLASFDAVPEARLAPVLVDTGDIPAAFGNFVSFELAGGLGPANLQAEHKLVYVDGSDQVFKASSVEMSYFLTGEHRPYHRERGSFHGRIHPASPLLTWQNPGAGAWEVAVRISHLDLNDGGVRGGSLFDVTLGLNWYLNAYTRLMSNVVQSHRGGQGDLTALLLRLQVDF